MSNEISLAILGTINVLYIAGSLASITVVIRKWWRGEPLVPFVPRDAHDIGGVFAWARRLSQQTRAGSLPSWQATAAQLGLDLRLGIIAFFAVFLPMILVHLFCQMFVPYEHEVIKLLKSDRSSTAFLTLGWATVVTSPILEELLFRNLLQGILEVYERMILGQSQRWIFGAAPIFLSSLAFALMHWGQGAASVPLFLFALVLGYLYFQTHRLMPSIVAHAMLNSFTMLNLWFMPLG